MANDLHFEFVRHVNLVTVRVFNVCYFGLIELTTRHDLQSRDSSLTYSINFLLTLMVAAAIQDCAYSSPGELV